jgi:adenylosuccinate lyase
MTFDNLTSISPIDGRYSDKTSPLKAIFSEFGLIKYRLLVEVRWLEAMSNNPHISEVPKFSPQSNAALLAITDNFTLD